MVSIVFRLSRSKRRKVIATRKNFMEKGRRADPIGSNLHTYGLVFSVCLVEEVRRR